MKWFTQFVDYSFYKLHREQEIERLYNVVSIETLFSTWNSVMFEYEVKDKKILRIFENDIDDFIFRLDFYNFLWLQNDIHEQLIKKYQYDTKRFLLKRKRRFNRTMKQFWLYDWIIRILN